MTSKDQEAAVIRNPGASVAPDHPITRQSEDLLDFSPFARAVAESIHGQPNSSGFVIALNGVWGSGKTSCANLIVSRIQELEEHIPEEKKTVIVRFEPWLFTGQETLIAEFFANLERNIRIKVGRRASKSARSIARSLAQRASSAGAIATAAVDAAGGSGIVTAVASMLGPLGKLIPQSWLRHGLPEQRTFLKESLLQSSARILVVIDDIDRLQPSESKQLLGLLKSIADLPGITYLLPVDLDAIRTSIDGERAGPSFLEKIVQASFDVPVPSDDGLRKMLSEGLDRILGPSVLYGQDDWESVAPEVFQTFIKTPRNVVQLLNSLAVSWPALRTESYFPDLFAIEAIRTFEHGTYTTLRDNKSTLLGHAYRKEDAEELHTTLEGSIRDRRHSKGSLRLAGVLFPRSRDHLSSTSRTPKRVASGRRISEDLGFDGYFRWSVDSVAASISEIETIQKMVLRGEDPINKIREIASRRTSTGGRGSAAILDAVLDDRLKEDPRTGALFRALLDLAETIVDIPPAADWGFSSSHRLEYALVELLSQMQPETRDELLAHSLTSLDVGLIGGAKLLRALATDKDARAFASEADVRTLADKWIGERISPRMDELRELGDPSDVIYAVQFAAGPEKAKALVDELLVKPESAQRLALGIMSLVSSSTRRDIYRELTRLPDSQIVDLPALLRVIRASDRSKLPERDVNDLNAFVSQAESLLAKMGPAPAQLETEIGGRGNSPQLILRNIGGSPARDVQLFVSTSDPGVLPLDDSDLKTFPIRSFPPGSELRIPLFQTLDSARVLNVRATWTNELGLEKSLEKLLSI